MILSKQDKQINDNISYCYNDLIKEMKKCLSEEEINIIISYSVYGETFKEISINDNQSLNTIIIKYHRTIKKIQKFEGENNE